ncbi:BAR and SH3 domain-containing protein [Aspergillus saccharolyticus JOP 1030-1]|uniref:SH3 domain signaling protein n=1 Tax=Aspergillus saccharolyticus JOP 1030-1 TaxID=1450539 RepID=A0A319A2S5_9EURO|nr:hypothetical protein BP01DRAFT_360097 [Aspergillus saccharolyticus JOP 1030-1]PYH41752.1 hypothetical protein BP01DRAFT_360097 [Aspergillus saccharolyticus JOP 1030-1]
MQSMQRQIGRFMKRSADESQVAILLKDFEEADKLLGRIIEFTSAWRDAWSSLLIHQNRMLSEFNSLYAPILGSSDSSTGQKAVPTPQETLARTDKLREQYEELRREILADIAAVDERMIQPATQAREYLIPMKKTIKKRDDRKLDYERYQGRVDNYTKKTKRSDRDNAALVKAESDLARAVEDYNAADEHLRHCLPPLIAAAFSLLPRLLAAQIELQNTMLARYYTVVLEYSQDEQFPVPAPPMEHIVEDWERAHLPVQQEVENFASIANGRTVRMSPVDEHPRNGHSFISRPVNVVSSYCRSPGAHEDTPPPKPPRPVSPNPAAMPRKLPPPAPPAAQSKLPPMPPPPAYDTKPRPNLETKPKPIPRPKPQLSAAASTSSLNLLSSSSQHLSPQASVPATSASSPAAESYVSAAESIHSPSPGVSSVAARADYFSRNSNNNNNNHQYTSPAASAAAAVSPGLSSVAARADYYSRSDSHGRLSPNVSASTLSPAAAGVSPGLSSIASRGNHFSRSNSNNRQPSPSPSRAAVSPGTSTLLAGKKKPPPPPPPPRMNSQNALFVTALYDFGGQGAGDLSFREGDRIRVLKKTESTDDWWEGELRGVKGSFPANYVE